MCDNPRANWPFHRPEQDTGARGYTLLHSSLHSQAGKLRTGPPCLEHDRVTHMECNKDAFHFPKNESCVQSTCVFYMVCCSEWKCSWVVRVYGWGNSLRSDPQWRTVVSMAGALGVLLAGRQVSPALVRLILSRACRMWCLAAGRPWTHWDRSAEILFVLFAEPLPQSLNKYPSQIVSFPTSASNNQASSTSVFNDSYLSWVFTHLTCCCHGHSVVLTAWGMRLVSDWTGRVGLFVSSTAYSRW